MTRAVVDRGEMRSQRSPARIAWSGSPMSVALAIAAAFLGVTGTLGYRLNVWQDEAYSLHTTSLGVWGALRQGVLFEAQAPLYFGMLALWRTLNGSLFFARMLSIGFTLVALYFAWRFARRYVSGVAPGVVLAAIAFNPFTVWAAVEVRPYAAAIALSSMLLYLYFRGWIDDDASNRARAAFVAVAIVGAYTQYYVATFVPAAMLGVVYLRRPKRIVSFALAACLVAVALVPIAFLLPLQLGSYRALNAVSLLPAYSILLALLDYLYPHGWIGSWVHEPLKNALYFLAACVPFAIAWRPARSLTATARLLLLLVSVITVLFACFIGLAHVPVLFPRHTAVLAVPVLLAAFAVLGSVSPARRTVALAAFGVVYVVFASLSLWSSYRHFSKNGDWLRVGTFLTANVKSGDAVAIFDAEAELPLRSYFRALPIHAIPRPLSFERFDEADFVLRDTGDVVTSLGKAAEGHARVWLVANDVCTTRATFYGCKFLDAYVARNFRVVRVSKFDASSVSELASMQGPH